MTENNPDSPVREYRIIVDDSGNPGYINRCFVATPTTGLVRMEWVQGRFGQMIPPNWSMVQMVQYISGYIPMRYQVADAQNLIVAEAIKSDFEWLMLIEHDTIPPPDAFIRFNQYIRDESHPVVSGLYYTRSRPSEPLVYRGRGTSCYTNWKLGDLVYADGVPTGMLLVHMGLIREMWKDAETYYIGNKETRRLFRTPLDSWGAPGDPNYNMQVGTSDLQWCTDVMKGDYLKKSGWTKFAKKKYPFLVDTNIFCRHINPDGEQFP